MSESLEHERVIGRIADWTMRYDVALSVEARNALVAMLAEQQKQEPVALCLRANSDGSYGEPVVFVGDSMFTENLEKAKKHPWIIYGAGELVPLYAAPIAKEPADQGYSKVHPAELEPVAQDETQNVLRDRILSERDNGNMVYWGLPGELMIAKIDEFVKQPADGILYDLNRLEVVSLTFLADQKWVNDFAVALVIRKLRDEVSRLLAASPSIPPAQDALDAKRYRWLRQVEWPGVQSWKVFWDNLIQLNCDEFDAAIDAAMKDTTK